MVDSWSWSLAQKSKKNAGWIIINQENSVTIYIIISWELSQGPRAQELFGILSAARHGNSPWQVLDILHFLFRCFVNIIFTYIYIYIYLLIHLYLYIYISLSIKVPMQSVVLLVIDSSISPWCPNLQWLNWCPILPMILVDWSRNVYKVQGPTWLRLDHFFLPCSRMLNRKTTKVHKIRMQHI